MQDARHTIRVFSTRSGQAPAHSVLVSKASVTAYAARARETAEFVCIDPEGSAFQGVEMAIVSVSWSGLPDGTGC